MPRIDLYRNARHHVAVAIEQAIEVNGVSVKMNTEAFRLGRLAGVNPSRLAEMLEDPLQMVLYA